jgi:hypothetical protein
MQQRPSADQTLVLTLLSARSLTSDVHAPDHTVSQRSVAPNKHLLSQLTPILD